MLKIVDGLCDDFNHFIGEWSRGFINKEDYKTRTKVDGLTTLFEAGVETATNAAKYEAHKSLMAYNIKTGIYNIAVVGAIVSMAVLILGHPGALVPLAASIAVSWFVDRAMGKTVMGKVGYENNKSLYLFKDFIIPK